VLGGCETIASGAIGAPTGTAFSASFMSSGMTMRSG
jgi:hypothetical protein